MNEAEVSRYDINLQLVDLKTTMVGEVVTENEDGSYTVVINSRAASNKQEEAKLHAYEHIVNDDLKGGSVQEIEAKAHHLEALKKAEEEQKRKQAEEERQRLRKKRLKQLERLARKIEREDEDRKRYGIYKSRDILSDPSDVGYDEPW